MQGIALYSKPPELAKTTTKNLFLTHLCMQIAETKEALI